MPLETLLKPILSHCHYCGTLLSTSFFMRSQIIHKKMFFFNDGEYFVETCVNCYKERNK